MDRINIGYYGASDLEFLSYSYKLLNQISNEKWFVLPWDSELPLSVVHNLKLLGYDSLREVRTITKQFTTSWESCILSCTTREYRPGNTVSTYCRLLVQG
jgi:hypothetical protein